MAELLPGRVPPFEVASGYHPIMDYRFVHAGQPRWVGADGRPIHYWETADPDDVRAAHANVPRGIELRSQPAERSDPVLTCTEPWEHNNGGPTIIRDGGLYRMWYHATAPDHWDPDLAPSLGWGPDWGGFLCYAESDDGFEWRKPALGQYEWQGHDSTNIVLGRELAGEPGMHGQSVFLDPQAPAHERFKSIYMGRLSTDVINQWVREQPERVDPWIAVYPDRGIFVATSPDGIKWTPHPDPVVIFISDTMNVADWNPGASKLRVVFEGVVVGPAHDRSGRDPRLLCLAAAGAGVDRAAGAAGDNGHLHQRQSDVPRRSIHARHVSNALRPGAGHDGDSGCYKHGRCGVGLASRRTGTRTGTGRHV